MFTRSLMLSHICEEKEKEAHHIDGESITSREQSSVGTLTKTKTENELSSFPPPSGTNSIPLDALTD